MSLSRRQWLALAALGPVAASPAWAHHGWSSFDQDRPLYLEGRVLQSKWRNPHVELVIETPEKLVLPADLAQRALPAQSAGVDGPALLAKTALPQRKDRRWELELAPLTRVQAWNLDEIKPGAQVAAVGFSLKGEQGEAILRVEYLFVGGQVYALRSSPV